MLRFAKDAMYRVLKKVYRLDQSPEDLTQFDMEPTPGVGYWLDQQLRLAIDRRSSYTDYEIMDKGIISSALDLISEDSAVMDMDKGRTIWPETKNDKVRNHLTELCDRLNVEEHIGSIARTIAKYGTDFEQLAYKKGIGVYSWKYTRPDTLTRVEDEFGRLLGFTPGILEDTLYSDKEKLPNKLSRPWDFIHFRTTAKHRELIHGESVIDAARAFWRPLEILLNQVVIYRLKYGPDRWVFYIDTGEQAPDQSMRTLERWRRFFKKQQYNGQQQYETEYNPWSVDDDIYFPLATGSQSRIDKLQGSSNMSDIGDVELYINLLFATLRIPKAFMGFEGEINAKATLVQESLRYARMIFNIQRSIISGFNRLGQIHLTLLGINPLLPENKFTFTMPISTHLIEASKAELMQLRVEVAERLINATDRFENIDKDEWAKYILTEYLKLPGALVKKLITPGPPKPDDVENNYQFDSKEVDGVLNDMKSKGEFSHETVELIKLLQGHAAFYPKEVSKYDLLHEDLPLEESGVDCDLDGMDDLVENAVYTKVRNHIIAEEKRIKKAKRRKKRKEKSKNEARRNDRRDPKQNGRTVHKK